ncbi:transcriptional regulator [Bacteroidia bacterium]|nr:transcriptional regulator [Bacteroidia bacterium]
MGDLNWYAVYTSSRAEKKVKQRLDEQGIENYLPLRTDLRLWSDRKKKVSVPLISGYIFVHTQMSEFSKILNVVGVVAFLREYSEFAVIPENQITRLRMMVENAADMVEFTTNPVHIGDTVIVERGNLKGLVGELVEILGKYKIAIRLQHFGCALLTIPAGWAKKIKCLP